MKNQWDMLVVGSGLSGMVIAHEAAQCGKRVLILEKRDHIGGNIFDYRDQNGVLVQKYGMTRTSRNIFRNLYQLKVFIQSAERI